MALNAQDVLAKMDLNGPESTGISAVSDVGLAAGDRLPVGAARGAAAPDNDCLVRVAASVLKHFNPDMNTAQPIPEQPKHVNLAVSAALCMTRNGWLEYGRATCAVIPGEHPDAANILAYLDNNAGVKADIGIALAVGSKLRWWQSNHHTRTGGHRVSEDELEGIVRKLYDVTSDQVGNVKNFLDTMWYLGHLMSTKMVIAAAYANPAEGEPVVQWGPADWGRDRPTMTADFIQRLQAPPAGTAQLQVLVDVKRKFAFYNGLNRVGLPKAVCNDFAKASVCMSAGAAWYPRMHIGSAFLCGEAPLFTDQSLCDETCEVVVAAIKTLGMKASYQKSQMFRDNWQPDMEQGIWCKVFKKVVDTHFHVINSGIDINEIARDVREASRAGAMSTIAAVDAGLTTMDADEDITTQMNHVTQAIEAAPYIIPEPNMVARMMGAH